MKTTGLCLPGQFTLGNYGLTKIKQPACFASGLPVWLLCVLYLSCGQKQHLRFCPARQSQAGSALYII